MSDHPLAHLLSDHAHEIERSFWGGDGWITSEETEAGFARILEKAASQFDPTWSAQECKDHLMGIASELKKVSEYQLEERRRLDEEEERNSDTQHA